MEQCTWSNRHSSIDEKFLLEGNGDQSPRRKKRHVTRDKRIAHLVEDYDRDQLIPYLDSLRMLSGRKLVFYIFNSNVICYFETCVSLVTLVTPKFNN